MALISSTLLLGACASVPVPVPGGPGDRTVLVIADPQLHNIHGLSLKQMYPVSDWVSRVAIRPPELNILAPLVLDHALTTGLARNPELMLVLGDVANIGCSGEVEQFYRILHDRAGPLPPVIMAHGNHDTFLMGTVNSYIPDDDAPNWKPARMEESPVPTDESWWDMPTVTTNLEKPGWRDGCYRPGTASSPMNKSRWLAKYISSLEKWGVAPDAPPASALKGPSTPIVLKGLPDTVLGKMNYQARGAWHRPVFGGKKPGDGSFTPTYRSYIVQRFDLGKTSTLVIDTSVCVNARGGASFLLSNAGMWGCIGAEQFATVGDMIRDLPPDHRLVVASHFPLHGLSLKAEGAKLVELLDARGKWTYLSAHTHKKQSDKPVGLGHDINMGSTTDWPMEWNLIRYPEGSAAPAATPVRLGRPQAIRYVPTNQVDTRFEVCRHLAVAEQLADLVATGPMAEWTSPPTPSNCKVGVRDDWHTYSRALERHIDKIHARYREDNDGYRERVLAIAAAASEAESRAYKEIK